MDEFIPDSPYKTRYKVRNPFPIIKTSLWNSRISYSNTSRNQEMKKRSHCSIDYNYNNSENYNKSKFDLRGSVNFNLLSRNSKFSKLSKFSKISKCSKFSRDSRYSSYSNRSNNRNLNNFTSDANATNVENATNIANASNATNVLNINNIRKIPKSRLSKKLRVQQLQTAILSLSISSKGKLDSLQKININTNKNSSKNKNKNNSKYLNANPKEENWMSPTFELNHNSKDSYLYKTIQVIIFMSRK